VIPLLVLSRSFQDIPVGFVPADESAVYAARLEGPSADWMVTLEDDRLQVETRTDWVTRVKEAPRPKADATVFLGDTNFRWRRGEGIPMAGGWLHAYDRGEFGGGIAWFSKDGSAHQVVSSDNTQAILTSPRGVYAVQALSHMGAFWYSRLVKVERKGSGWSVRTVTDLHEPFPQVIPDGGRFLYLAEGYVSTLETDGTQRELYRGSKTLNAASFVRRRSGELWFGASYGILRLRPKAEGAYAAQWFLPKAR